MMGGFELTAYVVVPEGGAEGIIAAIGDRHGGWATYLLDGRLVATVAMLDRTVRVAASDPVPPGEHVLSVRYEPGREPRLVLAVDGSDVAEAPLPGSSSSPTWARPAPACSSDGTGASRSAPTTGRRSPSPGP